MSHPLSCRTSCVPSLSLHVLNPRIKREVLSRRRQSKVCYGCFVDDCRPNLYVSTNQSYNNEKKQEITLKKGFRVVNHIVNPRVKDMR